jgi:uncharacterized protein YciI
VAGYYLVERARGPAWDPSRGRRDQPGWDEHAAFMDALAEEGVVVLGGPVGEAEGEIALLVVAAESEAEIHARLSEDPWTDAMLRTASVKPWFVLLRAGEPPGPDVEVVARAVIDGNSYMTIGTADEDGAPWVSPVWYAPVDYTEFLWVSDPGATHSRNIASRPRVAIVIFDSHVPGGWQGVYMGAEAAELSKVEVDRGIEFFSARSRARGLREWTRDEVLPPARHRLYRATAYEQFVLTDGDKRVPVRL